MERYLTVKEVAERLSVAPGTVYGWSKDGTLPARRIGRTLRFSEADIEFVLDRQAMRPHGLPDYVGDNESSIEKIAQDEGWTQLYEASRIVDLLRRGGVVANVLRAVLESADDDDGHEDLEQQEA